MNLNLNIAIVSVDEPVYSLNIVKRLIEHFPKEVKFICAVSPKPRKKVYFLYWLMIAFSVFSFHDLLKIFYLKIFNKNTPQGLSGVSKEAGIDFLKMDKFNQELLYRNLNKYKPDIIFFNQPYLIEKDILNLPRFGCWNKHFGKLPQFRGAFPFVHQFLKNRKLLSYSLYVMSGKLDCGDLLFQEEMPLDFSKSFSSNLKQLNDLSAAAIIRAIKYFKQGDPRESNSLSDEFFPYKTPGILQILKFKLLWQKQRLKFLFRPQALN